MKKHFLLDYVFFDFALAASADLTPKSKMTSPYLRTTLLINSLVGLIFNLSVHHLKPLLGAGYPFPIRFTQNLSLSSGLIRFGLMGTSDDLAVSSLSQVSFPPNLHDGIFNHCVSRNYINWFMSFSLVIHLKLADQLCNNS